MTRAEREKRRESGVHPVTRVANLITFAFTDGAWWMILLLVAARVLLP